MNQYNEQCNNALNKAINAINNNMNVVICGPPCSGKSYIRCQVEHTLKNNNYDIFYGISGYNYSNTINGRTYSTNKFWIEETKKELINALYDDYELIETPLVYNTNIDITIN